MIELKFAYCWATPYFTFMTIYHVSNKIKLMYKIKVLRTSNVIELKCSMTDYGT